MLVLRATSAKASAVHRFLRVVSYAQAQLGIASCLQDMAYMQRLHPHNIHLLRTPHSVDSCCRPGPRSRPVRTTTTTTRCQFAHAQQLPRSAGKQCNGAGKRAACSSGHQQGLATLRDSTPAMLCALPGCECHCARSNPHAALRLWSAHRMVTTVVCASSATCPAQAEPTWQRRARCKTTRARILCIG
jgi:hypothetical protein